MTTLTLQRRIAAPPDIVFDFLVTPDKLVRWLGVTVDMDPREPHLVRKVPLLSNFWIRLLPRSVT